MPPVTQAPQSTGAALELLVHGVGGATPQGMLDDPRIARVTGDATAAIYRRTGDIDAEQHPERYRDRPIEEAYCWSNLTSGNGSRALWLLLLPFMVVNLAHWMRPTAKGRTRAVRLYGVLVRLVALSLTVLLTAAACEVALDLVAWQCAGVPDCSNRRSWLGFLSTAQGGWWSQPGRRLALAALVPTALVGLLWYLSNRTWSAYESQRPLTGAEPDDNAPDEDVLDDVPADPPSGRSGGPSVGGIDATSTPVVRPALGRPGFWYGRRLVARLRAAHTAAGFLTVAASVAGAAARHDRAVGGPVPDLLGRLLEAMLVLGTLVVLWVVCRRGRSERRIDNRLDRAVISCLPGAALALLALAAVYAAWSRPGWVSAGSLPGDVTFRVLTVGQGALVVALTVVALGLYRRTPEPRTVLYGLGGPAVAMLACALGGVMSGGVAQRVADWLDGSGTPGMGRASVIDGPPVLLSWQASVIPVLLVLLLVPAAVLGVRTWLAARALEPEVDQEYGQKRPDAARTRQIARIRATAALTDSAPWLLGLVSGATLLLGAGAVAGAWASGEVPGLALDGAGPFIESVAEAAQSTGSWMVGFGFILFVTWGRRAYRDASARRTIGILWDVGTFWPRAAHPSRRRATPSVPSPTWRPGCPAGPAAPAAGSSSPAIPRAASSRRPRSGSCPQRPGSASPCSPTVRRSSGCTGAGSRPTSVPDRCTDCTAQCTAGAICGGPPTRSAAGSGSTTGPSPRWTGGRCGTRWSTGVPRNIRCPNRCWVTRTTRPTRCSPRSGPRCSPGSVRSCPARPTGAPAGLRGAPAGPPGRAG